MRNLTKDLPKVSNMESRSGQVPNQFIIETGKKTVFQSYQSIIAVIVRTTGQVYLDKYKWDYSRTTGKYRNQFLGMDKRKTERMITNGTIKLIDLNPIT